METIKVPTEWFESVHKLLYAIAHTQGALGEVAECLGSEIPKIKEDNEKRSEAS